MKIGLTCDLKETYLRLGYSPEDVAEFDTEETVAAIEEQLRRLGHEVVPIGGLNDLLGRIGSGLDVDMVFNICEGVNGIGREAQVPAILDAFRIPCTFSDAALLSLSLHKGLTKRVVRDLGVSTAPFVVVQSRDDLSDHGLEYPLFAKPVAEGCSKGIGPASRIEDPDALEEICDRLFRRFRQPVLVEEYLPGREFTTGLVGTGARARVIGSMEIRLRNNGNCYCRDSKERYEELVSYPPVDDETGAMLAAQALAVWRGMEGRDAGRIDFRMDRRGRLCFLEVNPLPGLHPRHSDLTILARMAGVTYRELIGLIVDSTLERISDRSEV